MSANTDHHSSHYTYRRIWSTQWQHQ